MIKQTFFSLVLTAMGAGGAAVFTQTFGGAYYFPEGIVISLTLLGLVLGLYFGVEKPTEEGDLPEIEGQQELSRVGIFAMLGLAIFAGLSFILPELKFSSGSITVISFAAQIQLPTLTISELVGSFVFSSVSIPVAEEQFFRGLWGNFWLRILPSGLAEVFSGITFMTFHAAVYSLFFPALNFNFIFILIGAGMTFVAIDSYTQDITTSMLAHMGNNALSFAVGGSIIAKFFPWAHVPWAPQVAIVALPIAILAYKMHKKGDLSAYIAKLANIVGVR